MKVIIFIPLVLTFLGCSAANGKVLVDFVTRQQRGSMIPVLGGVSGLLAALIAPWPTIHQLWWVPVLIDAGTIYWLIVLFVPRR
jgi:hypothetical protein